MSNHPFLGLKKLNTRFWKLTKMEKEVDMDLILKYLL